MLLCFIVWHIKRIWQKVEDIHRYFIFISLQTSNQYRFDCKGNILDSRTRFSGTTKWMMRKIKFEIMQNTRTYTYIYIYIILCTITYVCMYNIFEKQNYLPNRLCAVWEYTYMYIRVEYSSWDWDTFLFLNHKTEIRLSHMNNVQNSNKTGKWKEKKGGKEKAYLKYWRCWWCFLI